MNHSTVAVPQLLDQTFRRSHFPTCFYHKESLLKPESQQDIDLNTCLAAILSLLDRVFAKQLGRWIVA